MKKNVIIVTNDAPIYLNAIKKNRLFIFNKENDKEVYANCIQQKTPTTFNESSKHYSKQGVVVSPIEVKNMRGETVKVFSKYDEVEYAIN